MKPTDKVTVKMSRIEWDADDENALTSLPAEVEREYAAADFEDALSYDPMTDEYTFDEDIARDRVADMLSDEFGFCVNHVGDVEFSY